MYCVSHIYFLTQFVIFNDLKYIDEMYLEQQENEKFHKKWDGIFFLFHFLLKNNSGIQFKKVTF